MTPPKRPPTQSSPTESSHTESGLIEEHLIEPQLVVTDMDGTLLDGNGNVPHRLWPLLECMRERGIVFAPASGRPYVTLAATFAGASQGMVFIAENGAYVVRDGQEVTSTTVSREFAHEVITVARQLTDEGQDLGTVLSGKRSAYVERSDEPFLAQVRTYYQALEIVDDLDRMVPQDDILKLAIFTFGNSERDVAPRLGRFDDGEHQVVVSGEHWLDLMAAEANKGRAVRALQRSLGISAERTAVFGDYFNDMEMLDAAGMSFAMANAHPAVIERARYLAPSNLEEGVIATLEQLIPCGGSEPVRIPVSPRPPTAP